MVKLYCTTHSDTSTQSTHTKPPPLLFMLTKSTWQDCWCLSCWGGEMSRDKGLRSSCLFTCLSQPPDSSHTPQTNTHGCWGKLGESLSLLVFPCIYPPIGSSSLITWSFPLKRDTFLAHRLIHGTKLKDLTGIKMSSHHLLTALTILSMQTLSKAHFCAVIHGSSVNRHSEVFFSGLKTVRTKAEFSRENIGCIYVFSCSHSGKKGGTCRETNGFLFSKRNKALMQTDFWLEIKFIIQKTDPVFPHIMNAICSNNMLVLHNS